MQIIKKCFLPIAIGVVLVIPYPVMAGNDFKNYSKLVENRVTLLKKEIYGDFEKTKRESGFERMKALIQRQNIERNKLRIRHLKEDQRLQARHKAELIEMKSRIASVRL